MSDRSENTEVSADVENTAESENAISEEKEIFSTKRKITHAIRQNPLVHMGEKSEKPTILEKLKRAFSTDDSYAGGFIDDEPEGGGLLGEDNEDLFSGLFDKLKSSRLGKNQSKVDAHNDGGADSSQNKDDDGTDQELSDGDENASDKKELQPEILYDEEDALEESDFEFIFAVETDEDIEDTKESDVSESEHSEDVPQNVEVVSISVSLDKSESVENFEKEKNTVASETADEEKTKDSEDEIDTESSESTETEGITEVSQNAELEETTKGTEEKTDPKDAEVEEITDKIEENQVSEIAEEEEATENTESSDGSNNMETEGITETFEKDKSTETSENAETEEMAEKSEENQSTENKESEEITETSGKDKSTETSETEKITEKSEENQNSENKESEEITETTEDAETENSGFAKVKTLASGAVGGVSNKFKTFFVNARNKLSELWNEKIPSASESNTAENAEENDTVLETGVIDPSADDNVTTAVLYEGHLNNVSTATDEEHRQMLEGLLGPADGDVQQKYDTAQIKLVKNNNSATTEIDIRKVRESLNVITNDKNGDDYEILLEEPSILAEQLPSDEPVQGINDNIIDVNNESAENLTDEEKQQKAANQMVLDKVKEVEAWIANQKTTQADIDKAERDYNERFVEIKYITDIEITNYQVPGIAEEIKVKAGKFADSVRSEYEFYIGYRHLENVARNQRRINDVSKAISDSGKIGGELGQTASASSTYDALTSDKKTRNSGKSRGRHSNAAGSLTHGVEYRSDADKEKVKNYIKNDFNRSKRTFTLTAIITLMCVILFCFSGSFAATAAEAAAGESGSERIFAAFNLALFAAAVYVCKDTLINGFKPLRHFKASVDTSIALACAVTAVQAVAVLIYPTFFFSESLNVYTIIALLALTVNTYGRYVTAKRVKENFKFASAPFGKYSARFYHDKRMSAKLLSGTNVEKSEIVFQKRTSFLRNFLTLSYASNPGEDLSSKIAIPVSIFSLVISIVHAVIFKSFAGTLSVLSILLCMAVPMCGRLLGSMPLYKLSKTSLRNQAMVVGYPAVEHFAESGAIMIDAKELYPEGSVHMNGIKTFSGRRIDDALLAAAAVMVNAGGAMAGMFDGIIQGNKEEVLPNVDSVIYEDGKGLIGWVNKERVLVGNRRLLEEHGIEPPSETYERKYRTDGNEILYLANSGELVAMFIIGYSANRRVMDALRRMEESGMCILVRTVDVNITPERISKDFGIYYKSVKVLTTSMGNVIRDEMIGKEKTSPAYIATKGGVTPLGRAVSGCIRAKRNISLSLAIQVIEVLISLLLVTLLVLFAGVQQIGAGEMFLLSLIWCVAVIIAPILQKS